MTETKMNQNGGDLASDICSTLKEGAFMKDEKRKTWRWYLPLLLSLLICLPSHAHATVTDTMAVAIYNSGEWELMYAESSYKSAFEAILNDGTTMSEVFIHIDTLGNKYLSARGHRNDSTFSFSYLLREWTSTSGDSFLQVYYGGDGNGNEIDQCDLLDNICLECLPIGWTSGGIYRAYCDCWEKGAGPDPAPFEFPDLADDAIL